MFGKLVTSALFAGFAAGLAGAALQLVYMTGLAYVAALATRVALQTIGVA